ncbi:polysaccharide biosynthesis protein [Pseudohoeflea coraliihabitans]|uniref:Polysaccharide biosynthesis protein n=1 Tax=Pseudohoeflea coraliihabitans TaxID=2860393 RepID=A0ABS6WMM1_9HYPH|nr:nucleoside-diphosphate sugar epimerase/dehydratase [Pseudohoeflea sp. DP4N28-3]MBW3096903.1 polysaccharide biosynthesis protein [Pseudohoeflea sp. DP4N28-3]
MASKAKVLRLLALVHDIAASLAAFALAHLLAFGAAWLLAWPAVAWQLGLFAVLSVLSIWTMRLNRGLWRYASLPDMAAIIRAVTMTVVLYTLINFLVAGVEHLSRMAMVLSWVFGIVGLGAGRLGYRLLKERLVLPALPHKATSIGALVYPFSDTTASYLRALRSRSKAGRSIVGIIDNRRATTRDTLHGLKVLGKPDAIADIVARQAARGQRITELIVTDPAITGREMAQLLDHCIDAGIAIKRLPALVEPGGGGSLPVLTPNPVRLVDLLGRAEVRVDLAAVRQFLAGKTILVTGAGGSIGSELCLQIAAYDPARLVLLDASESHLYDISSKLHDAFPAIPVAQMICDVRDARRVHYLMRHEAPDVVFHAAAIKHVPIAERNPVETVKTNALGTSVVVEAAVQAKVKTFVLISTDKAVNPAGVMGAAKRAAELYCQARDLSATETDFRVVRFGNVLGSAGSVVPLFNRQIAEGGPVTVTDPDVTRYFMTIREAVSLILQGASHGTPGSKGKGAVLVLDMGEPVSIVDLAKRLIQLAGFIPGRDIEISFTGLRPGEKLQEELFHGPDDRILHRGEGYFVVQTRTVDAETVTGWFTALREACDGENIAEVMHMLHMIVPSLRRPENRRHPLDRTFDPAGHELINAPASSNRLH